MSMDLRIYGIRKLKDQEIAELSGKTVGEILESRFFRKYFPAAPDQSGYRFYDDSHDYMKSIEHMAVPVVTADDNPEYDECSYIYWEEELGYYWRNLSHDDPTIDEILKSATGYVHYNQIYSIVPYELVGAYMNKGQPTWDQDEIIAISYD